MLQKKPKATIGRAERVDFPELGLVKVPARIDTGARTSSIWVSRVQLRGKQLEVTFFGQQSPHHSGTVHVINEFDTTTVSTSTGHVQSRYKVRLLVKLRGKKIRAWFTLADRSTQVYPVLIGRNVLLGKFVVDVKKGHVLKDAEAKRTKSLKSQTDTADEETI